MKQNIAKILCFFILFILLFAGFYSVLQYRFEDEDGIEGIKQFYTLDKNSVDVMCFGSSHMFVDVNTTTLWEDYGIAGYDLGGTIQPLWNTYFYMKEALKTQRPKLMIVDCFSASLTEEYQEESGMIKNTFGMKLSKDKWDAICVSSPDKHLTYLLAYPGYHNRYTVLSKEDFAIGKGIAHHDSWMGNHLLTETADNIADLRMDNIADITDIEPIAQKQEEYLQKIIDLAKSENIPLLLINTPYFPTEREEKVFNRVAEIANEQQIPYINYNLLYDEMGLDFATDFADGHHLNYKGTPKFTHLLGDYIKEHYDIPDRRGEKSYQKYDTMTQSYNQNVWDAQLTETEDLQQYLEQLDCENYLVAYGLSGGFAYTENYAIVGDHLAKYGIYPDATLDNQFYIVNSENSSSGSKQMIFSSMAQEQSEWHAQLGTYDMVSVRCPLQEDYEDGHSAIVVDYNHEIYSPIYEGLTIFVYDKYNEKMVETVGFYLENGSFCLTKWR